MYITWFFRLTIWLLAMLAGPIGYFTARYLGIGESIWGNSVDGWGGDKPYRDNEAQYWLRKPWPDFWWSVVRNPANNLARGLAPSGTLTEVQHGTHFHTATISGEKLWFFYTPSWPVMFKFGYKLWPHIQNGDTHIAKLAFSLQRGK